MVIGGYGRQTPTKNVDTSQWANIDQMTRARITAIKTDPTYGIYFKDSKGDADDLAIYQKVMSDITANQKQVEPKGQLGKIGEDISGNRTYETPPPSDKLGEDVKAITGTNPVEATPVTPTPVTPPSPTTGPVDSALTPLPASTPTEIREQAQTEGTAITTAGQEVVDTTESERNRLINEIDTLLNNIQSKRAGLLTETEASGKSFLDQIMGGRKSRLSELSDLFKQREERLFSEEAPGILEALSGRGLLHSSAVGEEFAEEKGRLASQSQEALMGQSLADLDIEQKLAEDVQNKLFGIKSAGLDFETTVGQYGLGQSSRLGELGLADLQNLRTMGLSSLSELGRAGLERGYSVQDRDSAMELAKYIANMTRETETMKAGIGFIPSLIDAFIPG